MQTYDLSRFTEAHQTMFETALSEIRNGRKESHWMWYIFPQLRGLGCSYNSRHYGIVDIGEAIAFLNDPYLGGNLIKICNALLALTSNDPFAVLGDMGYVDARKLKSSMTLFSLASNGEEVFDAVLKKFFHGEKDDKTLRLLGW